MKFILLPMIFLYALDVGFPSAGEASASSAPVQEKGSKNSAVTDYPSLLKKLRALGAGAASVGDVEQPFFSIKGVMIQVHGKDVQIYQYAHAQAAEAEAAPISRDGMAVGTRKIFWVEPPHFYKAGRLVVLYVGNDDKVLKTLAAALGQQFAGQ